jgi:hypothetical protein
MVLAACCCTMFPLGCPKLHPKNCMQRAHARLGQLLRQLTSGGDQQQQEAHAATAMPNPVIVLGGAVLDIQV